MIEVGLGHYLSLGAIIFFLGTLGIFLNRKNVIVILMSIELILLAVNINFLGVLMLYLLKIKNPFKSSMTYYLCTVVVRKNMILPTSPAYCTVYSVHCTEVFIYSMYCKLLLI